MSDEILNTVTLSTYSVGDIVPQNAFYICVPCGYRKHLITGHRFPPCIKCMNKRQEFTKGLELWEKIDEE